MPEPTTALPCYKHAVNSQAIRSSRPDAPGWPEVCEVWVLKNANATSVNPSWTKLAPSGTPPGVRESSSAVYNATSNTLIVFGGDAGGSSRFSDVWLLSNANGTGGTPKWTQLTPSNHGPTARSGHSAIYDSVNDRMTIFGGYNGTILSDVWILSGASGHNGTATWTQGVSGQPRRFPSSLYDSSVNEMLTFGGQTSQNPLNPSSDIYTLTNANGLR